MGDGWGRGKDQGSMEEAGIRMSVHGVGEPGGITAGTGGFASGVGGGGEGLAGKEGLVEVFAEGSGGGIADGPG